MYLKVEDGIVRRNIEVFKIILKRASHAIHLNHVERKNEHFRAYVHRLTGEVCFNDVPDQNSHPQDWILVTFYFSLPEKSGDPLIFELAGRSGEVFSWDGLKPKALSILKETVKTIQFMLRFLPSLQNLPAMFKEISQVNVDSFLQEIPAKDLIHEAWHQINRLECEELLLTKKEGVFLFRQDEFAAVLEEQLSHSYKKQVKCVTLSYVDAQRKVVDLTLVKIKEGWMIYDGDPLLRGPLYLTIKMLLDHKKDVLSAPLLHLK